MLMNFFLMKQMKEDGSMDFSNEPYDLNPARWGGEIVDYFKECRDKGELFYFSIKNVLESEYIQLFVSAGDDDCEMMACVGAKYGFK